MPYIENIYTLIAQNWRTSEHLKLEMSSTQAIKTETPTRALSEVTDADAVDLTANNTCPYSGDVEHILGLDGVDDVVPCRDFCNYIMHKRAFLERQYYERWADLHDV